MKQHPSDDELRRAYEPFAREHERLRHELLAAMPERSATPTAHAGQSLRFSLRRTWLKVAALAACVGIAVAAWVLFFENRTTQAYTIDTVRKQIMQLKSFHVKGWKYVQSETAAGGEITERYPLEWFEERPHRSWNRGWGFSFNGKVLDKVVESYQASDGNRYIQVNHDSKVVVIGKEDPFGAELGVESSLQGNLLESLMPGSPANYKQGAAEMVKGVLTHQYERVLKPKEVAGTRTVIWLNPRTGLPVKSATYTLDAKGGEQLEQLYDDIEVNGPPPSHMFTFQPPKGYLVEKRDRKPWSPDDPHSSAQAGNLRLGVRYAFTIDDRAILLCWSYEDGSPVPWTEDDLQKILPSMTLTSSAGTRSCIHRFLRSDKRKSQTWRWSLLLPSDLKTIDDDQLYITIRVPRIQGTYVHQPLRIDSKRLADIVVRAQRATLPSDSPTDKILTLDQIKTIIDSMEKDRPKEP